MSTRGYDVRWCATRTGRLAHALVTLWPRSRVAIRESHHGLMLDAERQFNHCSSQWNLTRTAPPDMVRCMSCSSSLDGIEVLLEELRFEWAVESIRPALEALARDEAPF